MIEFAFPQSINVSLPDYPTAKPGTSITIPIAIGDITARDVIAYKVVINFNANVLDATGGPA